MKIVHYCASSYTLGHIGGVPRFDYQLSLIFPNRKFIKDGNTRELLNYLYNNNDALVITDNQLSLEIPNDIKTIVVHHGCAKHNYLENNHDYSWFRKYVEPQSKMFSYRNRNKTIFLSISEFTSKVFKEYYPLQYKNHKVFKILHPSELNENLYKKEFNNKPVILGNWKGIKKGEKIIDNLIKNILGYKFKQLSIGIKKPYSKSDIFSFNEKKQEIYLQADIFLNISNSEGNAYAMIDAMICGLPIVTTKVGLFFDDVPSNCFVELSLEKINSPEYVQERINFAWQNRYELSKNIREYYLQNCNFNKWEKEIRNLITNFNNEFFKPNNTLQRKINYLFLYLKILATKKNLSSQKLNLLRIKNIFLKICLRCVKVTKFLIKNLLNKITK